MENTRNNNNLIKSVFYYENPEKVKKDIYKDNNHKTGIYLWTHKALGKQYVGSSLNISQRLVKYYSKACLVSEIQRSNSAIYRAILKYGIKEFTFEVLEHCEADVLIEREQFYINTLKPEYNVLKKAGNRKGFMHSEATKELQRASRLGVVLSEDTKLKMSVANVKSTSVVVINNQTGEVSEFLTMRKAAEFLGTSHSQVISYINSKKLFRGIYIIDKKDNTD